MTHPLFNAYFGSDLFGKVIFLSLLALSIMTWGVFLQKFFLHKKVNREGLYFKKSIENGTLWRLKPPAHGSCFAKLLATREPELLPYTLSQQCKLLEKNVFILATIKNLAPFLGLLGTVWGILLTFTELQTTTQVNANQTVMGGLAMALGTTVLGLLVAIPALIAHNYLRAKTVALEGDMEDFAELLRTCHETQSAAR